MKLSSFIENMHDIHSILSDQSLGSKWSFLSTYRRVKKVKRRAYKDKIVVIKLFNYMVEYYNSKSLAYTFKEVFLNKDYYFSTNNKYPFIIDCGSNIGLSILYYKLLFPGAKIIAIEPDTRTFERLTNNVMGNKLTDITLINKAIYNESGQVKFYSDPNNPGHSCMSLIKERVAKRIPFFSEEDVETVLLSDLISEPVDFLKMDIEGAESLALQELAATQKLTLIEQMVIEYHHHIKPDEDNFSKILAILEDHGFGYQLRTGSNRLPERSNQDILIFAYRKGKQP